MARIRWFGACSLALLLALPSACSSSESGDSPAETPDSAMPGDGGAEGSVPDGSDDVSVDAGEDGSEADTAPGDSGGEPSDVAVETAQETGTDGGDVCEPDVGLGDLVCTCNELDDVEWNSSLPFLFMDSIDLGTTGWDTSQLTAGGLEIIADGNLGGSSIESEVLAYEVLARCEFAKLLKTEGEIGYADAGSGKKTDILVEVDGRKVGVSVTRAFHYPAGSPYTETEAQELLSKKLGDIPLAASSADPADAWERSMLSVLAFDQQHADMIQTVWEQLDPGLKGDIILFVTVTDGDDSAVY